MKRPVLKRAVLTIALLGIASPAFADDVFEVCKGESKKTVAGTGKPSIAVVYPEDFPVKTTPQSRNAVGAKLATAEKAKIVPAKDVEAAKNLVGVKKWTEKSEACGFAPSLVAVLGLKHPNLYTAQASVACTSTSCELIVDVERHGQPTAQRWVRYTAPIAATKDKLDLAMITAAGSKLVSKGPPPDAPKAGLAVKELPSGKVTVRSDVDGALNTDRVLESSSALAACGPKGRKAHDIRGYWANWMLSARGTAYQVVVKPFGGRDPADDAAAECLRKALESTQLACPRDGKPVPVKSAICL
ncbi:MAG TPA: hypothetical protein VFQ53_30605 [Kofleriaceae bacterium]|nr:hypothetical protein [Kofleriaceae bacterium]